MTTSESGFGTGSVESQPHQTQSNLEPHSGASHSEEWVVRRGNIEARYPSVNHLASLARLDELKPEHYVYHPLLRKWLYAKEVQELVPAFRRESASNLNKISWILFGVALLTGFAGLWLVTAVLFIAALVISVLYHVRR